ncbi:MULTISPECIES: DUF4190 domain-containing protein [Streptomyces]|uniref:Integral membrane protein n=1 Tax=Streptomyces venezuelae (strain ATCC 10712 / CBS 650.69 / DSM 40230 / JCM 4526 / NBRC 13096 / PD 04745) TaxID=953739 RepID=F2R6I5_STRVP|nr:DUF4190 domain-containing protein [Streptomyces venezuelae]APE24204.1 hypothetical protein vnz_26355 [Streptomyces venezuelae]QES01574.1 DUF4190 domain-containing protein [Streptomyces venezuelae ATCC 10712]CCA58614.1 integral membrane protein [Streptomyces venezuelae ATCC 10712]
MSDNRDQSRGGYDPTDPWAPPNRDGVELSKPAEPSPAPVHDQQTVTSMPLTPEPGGAVPPPPVAPGGPAATPGAYGYPAADTSAGYGYPAPAAAGPASGGYGHAGYPSYGGGYPGQPGWQQPASNGMGTAAMVLGIVAVAGFCLYGLGVILGILALIFGIIGIKKVGRGEATNRGMAVAGIVLGSIGIVVSAVFLGFVIWAIAQDSSSFDDSGYDDDPFASVLQIERDGA